jgi:hypothetical protein
VISPSSYDRPDRIRACPYPHTGACAACGFDGHHGPRFEHLERLQVRTRCTCGVATAIRRNYADAAADWHRHEEKVTVKDKRDECGCHRECVMTPHVCERPCEWPSCLTDAEHAALLVEVKRSLMGNR